MSEVNTPEQDAFAEKYLRPIIEEAHASYIAWCRGEGNGQLWNEFASTFIEGCNQLPLPFEEMRWER